MSRLARTTLLAVVAGLVSIPAAAAVPTSSHPHALPHGAEVGVTVKAFDARGFAMAFEGVTNEHARLFGDVERIHGVDCVQGSRRDYMCSYRVELPAHAWSCRLAHVRYEPTAASTIRILRADRVPRCSSVRDALSSLG